MGRQAEHYQQRIVDLEEQADQIKKQVRLSLPKSLFLPVPRTDLLEIVTVQDKVANRAKDIAGLVLGRQMRFPDELHEALGHYLNRSIQTSAQALKAMNELDELLETGFRGREADMVEEMIEELDNLESETDDLQVQIRRVLFALEKSLPAGGCHVHVTRSSTGWAILRIAPHGTGGQRTCSGYWAK